MARFAGDIQAYMDPFIGRSWYWEDFFAVTDSYTWGLWIGFFIGIAGGAIGLIGGVAI